MKFFWDQKYSVGVKSVDKQHQRFFEIVNEINYSISNYRLEENGLSELVAELTNYGEEHLKYEEDIFMKINYSGAETHCRAHDLYRARMVEYKMRLDDGETNIVEMAQEMADFARDWLSEHILAMDTKYTGDFLKADIK